MPDGLTGELIENPIVFKALTYIWDKKVWSDNMPFVLLFFETVSIG